MQLLQIQAAIGTAILLLSAPCDAKHGHSHSLEVLGRRHNHLHHRKLHATRREESPAEIQKRGTCAFPKDKGLVAVTPNLMNGGWAMSPDEPCATDTWCPYACPPGEVMNQWDPSATTYSYPQSMVGERKEVISGASLTCIRMVVSIAIRTAKSRFLSQRGHIASRVPAQSRLITGVRGRCHFAKLACQVTRPC